MTENEKSITTMKQQMRTEPDYATASRWWADLPDIWTPIGWKDHLFRFNVLWNGTIFANPCLNRRTEAWTGQGVQLAFFPSHSPELTWAGVPTSLIRDDAMVHQGWNAGPTPVLWSEWSHAGLLVRQEVFAHLEGGQPVETGIEPLFAWVRLSIHHACPGLPLEKEQGILIKINTPHFTYTMEKFRHEFPVEESEYPRPLTAEPEVYSRESGLRLTEDGNVRLAMLSGQDCTARLLAKKDKSRDRFLFVQLPAKVGAHVDLLVPMLPTAPGVFQRELALGYDGALAQANRYWSVLPPTDTRVEIPEFPLNDIIEHSLRFAEVIAEKNPADGQTTLLSGSLFYANLWTTPHSQASIMFLDTLGRHATVEKYLEIFRKEQGTVVPPGDCFILHPGYLSSPKSLTSIDWLSDHGAVLYTICEHALLSGNEAFTARWIEAVVKACEFIQYARSIANHPGVKGIMPPAVATDAGIKFQHLFTHWRSLARFQPELFWIAYRDGRPRAFLHGEIVEGSQVCIHLLAMLPGAVAEELWLLGRMEAESRRRGLARLVGPHYRAGAFYAAYILGCEPYHPHWAVEGTEAYVRAGFRISHPAVIMVKELGAPVAVDAPHPDYAIVACPDCSEFDARPFGFHALYQGQKVAHCYARLFPNLKASGGAPVGQIGNVTTDEAHRGKGLARVMSQMCLRILREWGAGECLVATGLDNHAALRTYEKVGFERRYNINEWSKDRLPLLPKG